MNKKIHHLQENAAEMLTVKNIPFQVDREDERVSALPYLVQGHWAYADGSDRSGVF